MISYSILLFTFIMILMIGSLRAVLKEQKEKNERWDRLPNWRRRQAMLRFMIHTYGVVDVSECFPEDFPKEQPNGS